MFLPFAFNNFPRCSCNCLSLHGFFFASQMKPKYPLEYLLAGKRVRSWNFSAQNSRIKKHRVKKGLGWFGLAVYFTAIPPHVHYKGVDNHLWRPWCTPSIPEKHSHPNQNGGGCLSEATSTNKLGSQSLLCCSAVLSILTKVSLATLNKMRKLRKGRKRKLLWGFTTRNLSSR